MSAIVGLSGIIFAFYVVFTAEKTGFSGYVDTTSMILLCIVPPCIMLLSHTLGDFFTGIRLLLASSFQNSRSIQRDVINTLSHCSAKVRSEGIGSLIQIQKQLNNDLLRDGIAMIVNDFHRDEIKHNLEAKIKAKHGQLSQAAHLFENLAKVCPGVGMIGTLVGLITMLSDMQDPSTIGSGMATAMITTLYGLLLGTILYAPGAEKILLESEKIMEIDALILEGVLHLKEKKGSLHLKNLVQTYGKTGSHPQGKPQAAGRS